MLTFTEILQDSMNKLKLEAEYRSLGLSPEQSLRMAFGEKESRQAFDDLATIKMKEEIKKLNLK